MCTVSFLPTESGILLASNRDEQTTRPRASRPREYNIKGQRLLFPKDAKASGTWIAIHENGGIAVLFNGAFKKHQPVYPYLKSRGLVFLDLVNQGDFQENYGKIDLSQIEPFSILFYQEERLWENRWDGEKKWSRQVDPSLPQLWASATLYDHDQISARKQLLDSWLRKNPQPSAIDLLQFQSGSLSIDPRPGMQTVSSTCIQLNKKKAIMEYLDLRESEYSSSNFSFPLLESHS